MTIIIRYCNEVHPRKQQQQKTSVRHIDFLKEPMMLFTTRGLAGMPESHIVSCFVLVAKLGERMEATGGGGGES